MVPAKATPVLKWAGGKRWATALFGDILFDYVQDKDATYVEPFLGGASMAAYLGCRTAVLGDAVEDLIDLYRIIRDSPAELAWAISAYAVRGVDKEAYLSVRKERPEEPLQRAARMVYLNRLSFNGLYRVNKKGKFNVPYGDQVYRQSVVKRKSRDAITSLFPHKGKFEALSAALQGASLLHDDFADTLSHAAQDGSPALVYVDPPYDGTYDSYTAEGFSEDDQVRLAEALWHAHDRGADILLHNSNTELIRGLYGEWMTVVEFDEKRTVAADPSSRDRAPCVIATTNPDFLVKL